MGSINYKTSDFITVGYNCDNIDYDNIDYIYDDINYSYEDIKNILNNYKFYFFHITIEPGYYEGFSINIELNYEIYYNDYIEKLQAINETTQLKKFLMCCIDNYDCCVVHPGWCTGYETYAESKKSITQAIKEMKETVKNTPTYKQYIKEGA